MTMTCTFRLFLHATSRDAVDDDDDDDWPAAAALTVQFAFALFIHEVVPENFL